MRLTTGSYGIRGSQPKRDDNSGYDSPTDQTFDSLPGTGGDDNTDWPGGGSGYDSGSADSGNDSGTDNSGSNGSDGSGSGSGTDTGGGTGADDGSKPPDQKPAQNFGWLTGYDQNKFNDPKHTSAKYSIGRILSQFDPSKGITPEVIAALNSLGYGTFSGNGDKLSLTGLTDAGRQAGLTGDYNGADFVVGYNSGHGLWGYADPVAEAAQGGGAGGTANGGSTTTYGFGGAPGSTTNQTTTSVSDYLKSLLNNYYGSVQPGAFNGTK
jgi:hypothetical protein